MIHISNGKIYELYIGIDQMWRQPRQVLVACLGQRGRWDGKGAQKSYGNSSGWEVRWDWGRGPDKLWALVWVKEFDEMRKGHRQVMGTHLGQGELDKMGKGPRRAVGAHLGQWESDDMGKDVRGCFTSSNVSSDISLSPLYIPPHCR